MHRHGLCVPVYLNKSFLLLLFKKDAFSYHFNLFIPHRQYP